MPDKSEVPKSLNRPLLSVLNTVGQRAVHDRVESRHDATAVQAQTKRITREMTLPATLES